MVSLYPIGISAILVIDRLSIYSVFIYFNLFSPIQFEYIFYFWEMDNKKRYSTTYINYKVYFSLFNSEQTKSLIIAIYNMKKASINYTSRNISLF